MLRGGVPESARWLLSRGRREEAEALIATYGLEVDVDAEPEERVQARQGGFRALFHHRNLRSTRSRRCSCTPSRPSRASPPAAWWWTGSGAASC